MSNILTTKISLLRKIVIKKRRNYFIENLAMLLDAGINPVSALKSLKKEFRSKTMHKVMEDLIYEVEGGNALWESMQKTGILHKHALSLVRLGEESGRLNENLKILIEQQQKQNRLKQKIKSATSYPALVLIVSLVVSIGVIWFILPRLTRVFASLNMETPLITTILIKMGNFLNEYGYIVIPLFLTLLILLIYLIFFFRKTNFLGHYILIKLPLAKELIQEIELARFGSIMGGLLRAGMPLDRSLQSLYEVSDFYPYKKIFGIFIERINRGDPFRRIFHQNPNFKKLIPVSKQQMIIFGEQSGSLEKIFTKIGKMEEEKADNTVKNLSILLEPILLVIVWIGVVLVALAIILPIYNLIGGFNTYDSANNMNTTRTSSKDTTQGSTGDGIKGESDTKTLEELTEGSPLPPAAVSNLKTIKEAKEKKEDKINNFFPPKETNKKESTSEEKQERKERTKEEKEKELKLKVLPTGIGYLNVREATTTNSSIIEQVNPGDEFPVNSTTTYWYEIELDDGLNGWVYEDYVEIIDEE